MKKKEKILLLGLFLVCFAGCALPLSELQYSIIQDMDAEKAAQQIQKLNAQTLTRAEVMNTISFSFGPQTMTAIGPTGFDEQNGRINVAAITPTGMTLFKLTAQNRQITTMFVMPGFGTDDPEKTAVQILKDIERIYFNRTPAVSAKHVWVGDDRILLETGNTRNPVRYTFTGSPLKLVSKTMSNKMGEIWSVDYMDYQKVDNVWLPFRMVFKHYEYGYRIEIETRDVVQ